MTTQVDKTKQVLSSMFKENVGCSMLDSGGDPKYDENGNYIGSEHGYGRHFEKLKNKNLDDLPTSYLRFSHREGEIDHEASLSTYHWLLERVAFDPVIDDLWKKFQEEHEEDAAWEIMEDFPKWLKDQPGVEEVCGLLDRDQYECINTYNEPSMLDGVLLWFPMIVKMQGDRWPMTRCLLQTHNGCDVRGGYSDPRAFVLTEGEWLISSDAVVTCERVAPKGQGKMFEDDGRADDPHRWRTEDAYRFHPDEHDGLELHEYIGTYDLSLKGDGEHLAIDEDTGEGYCPLCGAKLALYSF